MASEIVPTDREDAPFNGWGSNYGLGTAEFDFELWLERDGQIIEAHVIDIRTLPDHPELLSRMPEQWRARFLRDAEEARGAA